MEGGRVAETGAVSWVLERQARLRKERPLSTSPQFLPSSLFNSQVFLRFVFLVCFMDFNSTPTSGLGFDWSDT